MWMNQLLASVDSKIHWVCHNLVIFLIKNRIQIDSKSTLVRQILTHWIPNITLDLCVYRWFPTEHCTSYTEKNAEIQTFYHQLSWVLSFNLEFFQEFPSVPGFDYTWTYGGRASVPFPLQGIWAGGDRLDHVRKTGARGPDFLGHKALTEHHHREPWMLFFDVFDIFVF